MGMSDGRMGRRDMSKKVRALLISVGLSIVSAWGFRLFVLARNWETDSFAFIHLLSLLVSVGVGIFLLRVGLRGDRANRSDYTGVILSALFLICFWGYRWIGLIAQPGADTRERAHLHLASLFLVLGGLLFRVGWTGRNRSSST
jgi:hypothetical protein